MKYKRQKQYLDKIYDFGLLADWDLILEVNNSSGLPKKASFMRFLMEYQLLHFEKYGRYLLF